MSPYDNTGLELLLKVDNVILPQAFSLIPRMRFNFERQIYDFSSHAPLKTQHKIELDGVTTLSSSTLHRSPKETAPAFNGPSVNTVAVSQSVNCSTNEAQKYGGSTSIY